MCVCCYFVFFPEDQTPPASQHGSENPDEDEAWLDALEAGQLDAYGEIKRVKDPSLLTARQVHKQCKNTDLLSLMYSIVNRQKAVTIIKIIIANSYIAHYITKRNTNALNKKQIATN